MGLRALGVLDQLAVWDQKVTDPRGAIPSGFPELDDLLRRGGLTPGTMTILAGRTQTRKTTTMLNMMVNQLGSGMRVGFLGLDEPPESYVAKLASAMTGVSHLQIEDAWHNEGTKDTIGAYKDYFKNFILSDGVRPDEDDLDAWLEMAAFELGNQPDVIYIDYLSLIYRNAYDGSEVQRVQRAAELLQTWKNRHDLALVVLHQVGRLDEASNRRYHGDTPLSLESLKYGGEEVADIVLGSYRPAKDPLGNMSFDEAAAAEGDKFDEEKWQAAVARVKKYQHSTMLQVLKNRPGTRTTGQEFHDIELKSVGESQKMFTEGQKFDTDSMTRREIDEAS